MSAVKLDFTLAGKNISFAMSIDSDSATDRELLTALRVCGCPEPEVSDLMARVARPGDFVIDGGANIGFFTLLLSKLVGPEGYVLSFEPGQNNLFKLEENIKLNNCSNVEISKLSLWNEKGMMPLYLCFDGSKNSLSPHADTRGADLLETATLDSYATEDIRDRLRLIKLDIEGAEQKALEGGTSLLGPEKCPYIVMELNYEALPKLGGSIDGINTFLRDYGYSPFILHPNGALPTYIPRHTKVVPNRLNWNVLYSTLDMVGAAWPEVSL